MAHHEEQYAIGVPCLGCAAAALKVRELQLQIDAMKQQSVNEIHDAKRRIDALITIRAIAELATK